MAPLHTYSRFTSAHLTVDCGSFGSGVEGEPTADQLLSWIEHSPGRSMIHVVLKNMMGAHQGRSLQSKLQALGCTVTMRTSFAEKTRNI